jgi:hypothetical protein
LDGFVDKLLVLLSDKEKVVIRRRFNLDGKGKATLEEIGQGFSVTRERIRQIENNALGKMKRNVFNTGIKDLHVRVMENVRSHGGLMRKDDLFDTLVSGVVARDKINEGSMEVALNLHDEIECIGNTINFYPHVRMKNIADNSLKTVSGHVLTQMKKYGDARSVEKLHSDLKPVFNGVSLDVSGLKSLITIDKRLTLLDNDLIALLEWRHINPRTLRDKVLFILRNARAPMHFTEIADAIRKNNFDNKKINLQAVHNELIRHDQFVLIGRGIYALKEWGYESGTVAQVIQAILKKHEELSQDEIVDLVLKKRQVKKVTILLSLKNCENFVRVGRKHYRLKS